MFTKLDVITSKLVEQENPKKKLNVLFNNVISFSDDIFYEKIAIIIGIF